MPTSLPNLPACSAGSSLAPAGVLPSTSPPVGACASTASDSVASWLLHALASQSQGPGASSEKVLIGNGLPCIPKKLVTKIRNWEFVDLAELLPSTNPLETAAFHGPPSGRFALLPGLDVVRQRRKQILTIGDWILAFAAYTATLVSQHPAATLEMLAYMMTIIRASQQYDGLHWRAYDYHYRLTAAASGNKNWSRLDTDLFTRFFTGRARSVSACALCDSLIHGTSDCPEGSSGGRSALPRKREFGKAGGVGAPAAAFKTRRFSQNWAPDICAQFNAKGTCSFAGRCKFRHACAECGGSHPAKECSGTK